MLNEFGELIGVVGDPGRPGEATVVYRGPTFGLPVVPIMLISVAATATPDALADYARVASRSLESSATRMW